jgi:prephenate dehydrogenase
MRWDTIAIIGVGMIGGSVGLALRRRHLCKQIVGIGRREESLQTAQRLGAVDHTTTDLATGVSDAQLVVVCSPINQIAEQVLAASRHCAEGTLITDAGSTKQGIIKYVERRWDRSRDVYFVGSHPIAGSEKTGPQAAWADLFEERLVVVTPTARSRSQAVTAIEEFWQSLGARTIRQSPSVHDRVLAATSHMPHVVAAALAACTSGRDLPFAGTGWADTTRIASGEVDMWRQILLENQQHVLQSLGKFAHMLARFCLALENKDHRQLTRLLTAGKKQRDALGS